MKHLHEMYAYCIGDLCSRQIPVVVMTAGSCNVVTGWSKACR